MNIRNKTFTMPSTKFNKGFVHIGKTFKVGAKIPGIDRHNIVLLTKTGKETTFSTCAGTQWIERLISK